MVCLKQRFARSSDSGDLGRLERVINPNALTRYLYIGAQAFLLYRSACPSARYAWMEIAPEVDVVLFPGDHTTGYNSIVQEPNVRALAQRLQEAMTASG